MPSLVPRLTAIAPAIRYATEQQGGVAAQTVYLLCLLGSVSSHSSANPLLLRLKVN